MKKIKHHEADIKNKNTGTSGVSVTRKKNVDNTSDQLNPNNPKFIAKKGEDKKS